MAKSAGYMLSAVVAGITMFGMDLAGAIGVTGLKDFPALYGRYAPEGDCSRQPRIIVNADGFTFEHNGDTETVSQIDYAASYGGNYYEGISQWFFPFNSPNGFPVLMTFNDNEKLGRLTIISHDEGWPGGPKLASRHQALVNGSPYTRCQ